MSLYNRQQNKSLGNQAAVVGEEQMGLQSLMTRNPLSSYYQSPCQSNSPRQIVIWMLSLQQKAYNETVEQTVPFLALVRNIKLLMEEYEPDAIKRAIHLAIWHSQFPFATGFVRKKLEELGYESQAVRCGRDQEAGASAGYTGALWD